NICTLIFTVVKLVMFVLPVVATPSVPSEEGAVASPTKNDPWQFIVPLPVMVVVGEVLLEVCFWVILPVTVRVIPLATVNVIAAGVPNALALGPKFKEPTVRVTST